MRGREAPAAQSSPRCVVGVFAQLLAEHGRAEMPISPDSEAGTGRRSAIQVGDMVGEIAAAMTYLELLRERLHMDRPSDGRDAAAIPPSTVVAIRRSCQRVSWHSGRALAAMSPGRAAQAAALASQLREIEELRFRGRRR